MLYGHYTLLIEFFEIKQTSLAQIIHFQAKLLGIIINMLRQSTNSKKIFYKGMSLKDYIRKSAAITTENEREETLLVDEFNQPLVNIQDLTYWEQRGPKHTKLDSAEFSTKVSTTKSGDQDLYQYLPPLLNQKPTPNPRQRNIYQLNCSDFVLKRSQKKKTHQLPSLELSKSKVLKRQSHKGQQIAKRRPVKRQKCLASRQVSRESEEEEQTFQKGQQRSMSNRQYVEQVKRVIFQRRHLSLKKSDNGLKKGNRNPIQNRTMTEEI